MSRLATALIVAATGLATLAPVAHAQPNEQRREAAKERWEKMTPEQRAAAKEKMKERWENMTPEQQAAAKKRFAERHPEAAAKAAEKKGGAAAAASAPK